MPSTRQINVRELAEDFRTGASGPELMDKYQVSALQLQELLNECLEAGFLQSEDVRRLSSKERPKQAQQVRSVASRHAIGVEIPIYEKDRSDVPGRLLDIAETGVRIKNLPSREGEMKHLVIPADEVVLIDEIEFEAVCRWTRQDQEGLFMAGFEITGVSQGSLDELRILIQSISRECHLPPEVDATHFDEEATQTVDLASLFSDHVSSSGSFSLRGLDQTWFGKLLQALPIPALLIDKSCHIILANQSWARICLKYDSFIGKPFSTLFSNPFVGKEAEDLVKKVFETRKPESKQAVIEMNGGRIWGRMFLRSVRAGESRSILLLVEDLTLEKQQLLTKQRHEKEILKEREALEQRVIERTAELHERNIQLTNEIAQRERAEQAARESEAKYRMLVENAPVGIVSCDAEGAIEQLNPQLAKILGPPGFNGPEKANLLTYPPLVSSGISGAVQKCLEAGESVVGEYPYMPSPNKQIYARLHVGPIRDENGNIAGAQAVMEDVSDHKRAEWQVLRSERLKALVEMAAGVSNHFNLSLQLISSGVQMAMDAMDTRNFSEVKPLLEQIQEGSYLAAQTVRRLQQFARARSPVDTSDMRVFDLGDAVGEGIEKAQAWWKTRPETDRVRIKIEQTLELGCHIEGDQDEIVEVAVNLLKNSMEALPAGGEIWVRTYLDEGRAFLEVQDNGVGIPKKDIRRVGDPFWSSKKAQAGMGLAVSFGIIRRHRGTVTITSEQRKGTTFTIGFPLVSRAPETTEEAAKRAADINLRILFIEDNPAARRAFETSFKVLGQSIFATESAEPALEIFEQNEIDAVLCSARLKDAKALEIFRSMQELCLTRGVGKPPFVLLTDRENQPPRDELMAHPEIDRVVERPIAMSRLLDILVKEVKAAETQTAFSGSIHGIDILEYVQIVLFTGQQVVLEIRSKEGESGHLYIDRGEFRHATCGELRGEEALYRCLRFRGGSFCSLPWREPDRVTIEKPGEFLLMEAARKRDEGR